MYFAINILIHVLFIACMVFIIGYVFGPFSGKRSLTVITRIAAILVIVLFIAGHFFFMGTRDGSRGCFWHRDHSGYYMDSHQRDSTGHRYHQWK
jgi:hypothetical protein